MKRILTFITACCAAALYTAATAQDTPKRRTLDELISRLVESNYEIMMQQNSVGKAANNVTTAPFLPTLSATARQNQEIVDKKNSLSVGAQFSWRLFDGAGMFHQYKYSKEALSEANLLYIARLEDLVSQIMAQYNYIITLTKRVELGEQTVRLSRERYTQASDKYNIGSASGLDMKLAKTDLNADSSLLISTRQMLDVAYIRLSGILNYDTSDKWCIYDSISVSDMPSLDTLSRWSIDRNTQILLSKVGVDMSELSLKISQATRYPTLDFGAAGNIGTLGSMPAASWSAANGASWGFTLSAPIFNGDETNRKIRNAKIDKRISELAMQDAQSNVLSALAEQHLTFRNNLQLIDFEQENANAMELNLDVAMERYRLGELSGIDFRNIQLQYLSAKERQLATVYQAKLSQIELMILSGTLL